MFETYSPREGSSDTHLRHTTGGEAIPDSLHLKLDETGIKELYQNFIRRNFIGLGKLCLSTMDCFAFFIC